MHLDENTVVIVDIDKTALGALGRNDSVIDRARLDGIYRTMNSVLGDNFDTDAFESQYAELNNPEYHCITADNQDYLAYLCLVMNTKLIQFDELVNEVQSGNMDDFEQFTRWVNVRMMINPVGSERLRQVHETVMASLHVGDLTPFKRFRRQEFMTTVERMGSMADDSSVTEILQNEIALTNEVCEVSKWFRKRDCLLLCLSDKPSEASCPDPDVLTEHVPIHEIQTHLVGTSIQSILNSH
ncbi:hypothetical protein KFU94_53150 [Chloroflexi bacterium TSY]|nr:hypothetical protein [Chloroflexi bacterium TSY]